MITDISIRTEPGSITCVLGPNGSGKSTLLKAVVGLLKPMSGRVLIEGHDVTGQRPHEIIRQGIAYVPQTRNVFVSLNVEENLEMGAYVAADRSRQRLEKVLGLFPDLRASPRKRAGDLSVGQRNLLGLARALMVEPAVVLVDEPTAGLSPENSRRIWQQLQAVANSGTSVLVVEQNVDMALANSNECYVLVAGRRRFAGTVDSLDMSHLHELFLGKVEGIQ